ncbi:MAG: CHC2 zinc finger domain-containing protein, partial [Limnohabitans sp.]
MKLTPIELVLSRLDKVRQRQVGQWSACCPSHKDTTPSLSVRETEDGAVLLHCFAR